MLPKDYRKRYALIFLISFAAHLSVLVALLYQPAEEQTDSETKSVTVNLKPTEDIQKVASQKQDKQKKEKEQEKPEPKKAEPKKAEAKKAEAKKAEPKKAEAKKAEAKKAEAKKAEAKKAEAKKAEAKKAEAKKAEAKKAEAKKAEAKKAEAKKAEAKKAEAKKATKERPKAGGAARQENKSTTLPPKPKPARKPVQKPAVDPSLDKNSLAYWLEKSGSLTALRNKELRATIIATSGESRKFANRDVTAKRLTEEASPQTRAKHNRFYAAQYALIERYFIPPAADGGKYDGYIRFLIDDEGYVTAINLKKPSGSAALDDAFLKAIQQVKRFPLPQDPEVRKLFIVAPKRLFFNETDMR